jgi:hypothetical protein
VFFIANTGNVSRSTTAAFRISGKSAEWWDPLTGDIETADILASTPETTSVTLDLEPYGSRILVFSDGPVKAPPKPTANTDIAALDLSAGWRVTFAGKRSSTNMDRLQSWTAYDETRYFSGLATYEKAFVVPEKFLRKEAEVRLELGEGVAVSPGSARGPGMQVLLDAPVREAAIVYVNGRHAGSVWCPPYTVPLTRFLKVGENQLRIVVGNLAVNHMAGHAQRDYRLLNLRYGVRFEPQDMDQLKPVPAGLLGPIRLTAKAPRN